MGIGNAHLYVYTHASSSESCGGLYCPLSSAKRVAGVMVSIVAFQAVDPGSIPGPRIAFGACSGDAGPITVSQRRACLA